MICKLNRIEAAEIAALQQQIVEFNTALKGLSKKIEQHYEKLVDSVNAEPIVVSPLNADLIAPRVINVDKIQDLGDAIENLDRQFAAWEKSEKNMDGKMK